MKLVFWDQPISRLLIAVLSFGILSVFLSGCLHNESSQDTLVLLGNPISDSLPNTGSSPILPNVSYSNTSLLFVKNIAILPVVPVATGNPTTFSISPSLPSGLTWNSSTGEIAGTPTSSQNSTSYTITASNTNGSNATTIDITIQALDSFWGAYLKASNAENFAGNGDSFGIKVAVSGDTMVVGATGEDSNQTTITNTPGPFLTSTTDNDGASNSGAAYVFRRIGANWVLESYIKAPNAEAQDAFGTSVAISGDTIVIGAIGEDSNVTTVANAPNPGLTPAGDNDSAANSGAAYVFRRSGTTWAWEAYLKAPNTGSTNQFGNLVAISGDTIVVSAIFEDSDQSSITNSPSTFVSNTNATDSGAAYVYQRTGSNWAFQSYLKAPNAEANDNFGSSLAISEDSNTIAIGAKWERSNQTTISDSSDPNLTPTTDNDTFPLGSGSGAVYVYTKSGSNWVWQAYIKSPNNEASDQFGVSLSLSGNRIVVGATGEDSNQGTIVNAPDPSLTPAGDNDSAANSGAAYVFVRSGTTWSWEAYLKAPNPENFSASGDLFGTSVSILGDMIVVGATGEDSTLPSLINFPSAFPTATSDNDGATNSGAVYVFHRSSSGWNLQSYIKAPNAENVSGIGDGFGTSIGISNDCVVVGANGEDSSQALNFFNPSTPPNAASDDDTALNSGAVYTFDR
ncbi:putative Ig domain-containing protein [Leptospira stimsonii]|uniref:Integrin n=1 Tax=Leptospira stimsonii TaxID=2202203 RepID=A0A8B3CSE1_9LEPT|nr:putative Ig domain-containing protein [Leptospira stimsonii]RHX86411.1 hypothetical protein DLM78_11335 [Leptospira stimsonii]